MNRVSNRDASSRNNNNNRQRNRGRNNNSNNSNNSNNNRRGPNPLQRSYESNGPDVKIRGNAMQVAEKYLTLARDAQVAGDRVLAENYMQHAEHYTRIIAAAQAANQQTQQAAQQALENQPQPALPQAASSDSGEHVNGAGPQPIIEQPSAEMAQPVPSAPLEEAKSAEAVVENAFEHSSAPADPVAADVSEVAPAKPKRTRRPKAEAKPAEVGDGVAVAEKPARKPRVRKPKVVVDVDAVTQSDSAE